MVKIEVTAFLKVHGRAYAGVQLLDGSLQAGQVVTNAAGLSWVIQEEKPVSVAGQTSALDKYLLLLNPVTHTAQPVSGEILTG